MKGRVLRKEGKDGISSKEDSSFGLRGLELMMDFVKGLIHPRGRVSGFCEIGLVVVVDIEEIRFQSSGESWTLIEND